MSDVFSGVAAALRPQLVGAAVGAAEALGIFDALAGATLTTEALAARAGVAARRLRALCDVLALDGVLARDGGSWRLVRRPAPVEAATGGDGWGRLAEVLRSDRPVAIPEDGEALARYHGHLATAGAAAARAVAARLAALDAVDGIDAPCTLLDGGAGTGTYAAAWLAARPGARATLVDRAPVLALARAALADRVGQVEFFDGDVATARFAATHRHVVLANLLHLHGARACARIVANAATALMPGGWLVVKDLRIDEDRSGPATAVLFALNMSVYTDEGDVHRASEIEGWLDGAGLVEVRTERLEGFDDAMLVMGRLGRGRLGRGHSRSSQAARKID